MKKNVLRLISAVLLLIMAISVFTSCGKKKDENAGELIEEQTEENPNIPAKDYEGYEFTLITKEGSAYNTRYLVAEAETGEVLGDAITKRNSALEQKYNIKIKHEKVTDMINEVRNAIMSGTVEFDAIFASMVDLSTLSTEKLLYDLNTIDRFDFSKSYWDKNSCEQLEIGGKLYFANCSTNIHAMGSAMFFNKHLVDEYGLTSPYEHMKNNNWTIDTYAEMAKSVNADLDGDGLMTVNDRFGAIYGHSIGQSFVYAAGIRATTNNAEGKPVVTLLNNKNKLETIYTKLHNLYSNSDYCICTECDHKDKHNFVHKYAYSRYCFTQDMYLFTCQDAEDVHEFAQMEHEFGIVPMPTIDSSQENYLTEYPVLNNLLALPILIEDFERTTCIIEDMNYFSSYLVYPTWFEVILSRRYARDDESEETLKLLKDNRVYDIGLAFDFGGIRTKVLTMDLATSSNVIRNYDKYKRVILEEIDDTYKKYLEDDE